mgnify:CR=1 FL=1
MQTRPPDSPVNQAPRKGRAEARPLIAATLAILLAVTALQWWQLESSTRQVREETLAQVRLRATEVTGSAAELIDMLLLQADGWSAQPARPALKQTAVPSSLRQGWSWSLAGPTWV